MPVPLEKIKPIRPWSWKGGPREASKRYVKIHPWYPSYNHARERCKPKGVYGKRGIRLLMRMEDFKFLWLRDNAGKMRSPEIDRINDYGNYELSNCRFMENEDHVKRIKTKTEIIIKEWDETKTLKELSSIFNKKYPALLDISKRYKLKFKFVVRKKLKEIECEYCKEIFMPRKSNTKTCSLRCSTSNVWKNRRINAKTL